MEKKPLVTVLTPTYNRVHLLETLVQSLCRQSAQDFQWLVVMTAAQMEQNSILQS